MRRAPVQIRRREDCRDLPLPAYMSENAAGMDLYAAVRGEEIIAPGQWKRIPTGLSIALPEGFEGQVRPRSGLALRKGIGLVNAPGTIDADYRGEIGVLLINLGEEPFHIRRGDRIAQMVIAPVVRAEWIEVGTLPGSERATGGFGHTGIRENMKEKPENPDRIWEKAGKIRWIFLDVDGVLTEGRITYDSQGREIKSFHVRDGHGIKLAQREGIHFAIITGRSSPVVEKRAKELGINEVIQGAKRKIEAYEKILQGKNLSDSEIAYVGDDLVDLPVLRRVGLSATVLDADPEVRAQVDLVLSRPGGQGAVRELIEFILKAQDKWREVTRRYHL